MIKKIFKHLGVVLLAGAVGLTYVSFTAGKAGTKAIEIKVEDILLLVLGLIWIANILLAGQRSFKKPPLLFPILAWVGIGLFTVLANWIFMNIGLGKSFFFFLKEIEFFFLYFYLFYHIRSVDSVKFIIKVWIFLGLVNIAWVIYQIVNNITKYSYYGPGAIGEGKGPLTSGGFFLLLFLFFFNLLIFHYYKLNISKLKKAVITVFAVSPVLGIFTSGSRTALAGLFFSLIFIGLFYLIKHKKKLKAFLIIILMLIILITSLSFIFDNVRGAKRGMNFYKKIAWELSQDSDVTRFNIWKINTAEFLKQPLFMFFGMGKSVILTYGDSHNQYVRNFIETGIVGFLIFFFLIFIILKKSLQAFLHEKDSFIVGLCAGHFIATLTMLVISLVADAFMLVKLAETYWFFTALTMVTLYYHHKPKSLSKYVWDSRNNKLK